jgi:hypothetical protein
MIHKNQDICKVNITFKKVMRADFFEDKSPTNENSSVCNPKITSAAIAAHGARMDSTFQFCFLQTHPSPNPGSFMHGVWASRIKHASFRASKKIKTLSEACVHCHPDAETAVYSR